MSTYLVVGAPGSGKTRQLDSLTCGFQQRDTAVVTRTQYSPAVKRALEEMLTAPQDHCRVVVIEDVNALIRQDDAACNETLMLAARRLQRHGNHHLMLASHDFNIPHALVDCARVVYVTNYEGRSRHIIAYRLGDAAVDIRELLNDGRALIEIDQGVVTAD